MHSFGRHSDDQKPEIVQFYNATKSGVDNLDKLVRTYRSQRKCHRWPYGVFMTLADCAVVAALRLSEREDPSVTHYRFKLDLGY